MGWFKKIISFFIGTTPIGSSIKAIGTVNDIINSTKDGLDALGVTDEQKAETVKQTLQAVNDYHKTIAGENTDRSRTRRQIALAFVVVYLTLTVAGVIVWRLDPDYSQHIFDVVASKNALVTMIMIFYFGYYAVGNVVKAVKAKKE